ncbi:hypothetical protein [Treponema sp.]|uniref:hypothetical protein n=1 Tax=Treponema sp. TaxID=166 RepID=UPI00388EDA98
MKKVLKTLTAVSATFAVALSSLSAEITIKEQARIRTSVYSYSKPKDGDESSKLWNLKNASAADYLNFYANNEYAGVAIESVINAGNQAQTGAITFDTYYGYLNYGDLKFTFGDFDSRFTNRYNVTATEAGLLDSDFAKFGLSNKLTLGLKTTAGATTTSIIQATAAPDSEYSETSTGSGVWVKTTTAAGTSSVETVGKTWLYDFGNVAQSAGGENLSLLADYTLSDIANGKLLIKGGLIEYAYDTTKKFSQLAGYIFEATWQGEVVSLDLIFKNPEHKAFGGGAYLTLKPVEGLAAVLGFTGGVQKDVVDLAFAVDARFQYAFTEAFKTTLVAKYSSLKLDGARDPETGLEVGAEFSYVANETLTFALDGRLDYVDLDNNDKLNLGENTVTVSPRAKISAGSAAAITAAVEFTQALNTSDDYKAATKTSVAIPVIFRVKL